MGNGTSAAVRVGPLPVEGTLTLGPGEVRCFQRVDDARDVIVGDLAARRYDRLRFQQFTSDQATSMSINGKQVEVPAGQRVDLGNYELTRSAGTPQMTVIVRAVTGNAGLPPLEGVSDATESASPSASAQ